MSPAAYRLNSSESIGTLSTGLAVHHRDDVLDAEARRLGGPAGHHVGHHDARRRGKPSPAASVGVIACIVKPMMPAVQMPVLAQLRDRPRPRWRSESRSPAPGCRPTRSG